jgi:hypothetical protein
MPQAHDRFIFTVDKTFKLNIKEHLFDILNRFKEKWTENELRILPARHITAINAFFREKSILFFQISSFFRALHRVYIKNCE